MNQSEQFELNQPLNIRFHRFSNVSQPCSRTRHVVQQRAATVGETSDSSAGGGAGAGVGAGAGSGSGAGTASMSMSSDVSTPIVKRAFSAFKSGSNASFSKYYFDSEDDDEVSHAPASSPCTRARSGNFTFSSSRLLLGSDYQLEVERNRRLLAELASPGGGVKAAAESALPSPSPLPNPIARPQSVFAPRRQNRAADCVPSSSSVRNSCASAINSCATSNSNSANSSSQQVREPSLSSLQSARTQVHQLQSAPLVIVTNSTGSGSGYNVQSQPAPPQASTNYASKCRPQPGYSLTGSVSSSSLSYYLQAASPTPSLNDLTYLRTPSPSECETDSDREGTIQSCCSPTTSVDQSAADRFASRRCASLKLPRTVPHRKINLTVPGVEELRSPSDGAQSESECSMAQQLIVDDVSDSRRAADSTAANETLARSRTPHENAILRRGKHATNAERGHRMSLLGKPICIKQLRQARTDARWRKLQSKIYNFLERPKTIDAITYHVFVFISVFICLLLSVLSTIDSYKDFGGPALFHMEAVMLVWFTVEYVLRMWSAGCRSRYQGWRGRLLFARRPFCIIDLIVILASTAVLIISICHGELEMEFVASPLRALRFFQILRMMRMDRRGGSFKLLASVVWAHRQELFTTVYIGFLILISTAFLMYLAEKDHLNTKFQNFADALWWGVITLCTVGYGDTVPQTPIGKIIASVCAVAGISFFALPAGILGSGFALKVQQHQRQKHLIRRRGPAALLIQSCWRVYAADPCSASTATWKPHLKPIPSPTVEKSRFGRLTIRRKSFTLRQTNSNPSPYRTSSAEESRQHKSVASSNECSLSVSINTSSPDKSKLREKDACNVIRIKEEERDSTDSLDQLNEAHKNAIRAIRKIRFLVARRKFRETLRPYDVKDVIEQYAAGHLDMLSRIKILQARLEQILGRSGSNNKDYYDSKISLAARIVNVERVVEQTEGRMDSLTRLMETQRDLIVAICEKLNVPDLQTLSRAGMYQYPPSLSPITDVSPEESPRMHARLTASVSAPYTVDRAELHLLGPPSPSVTQRNRSRQEHNTKSAPSYEDVVTQPADTPVENEKGRAEDSGSLYMQAVKPSVEDRPISRFRKARSLKYHSRHHSESTAARPLVDATTQTSVATESGAGLFIRITDDGDSVEKCKSPTFN